MDRLHSLHHTLRTSAQSTPTPTVTVGGLRSPQIRTTSGGLRSLALNHLVSYPTPANLSYLWSFGSLAALCLGLQLLSGIFIAMHYVGSAAAAFGSVEHLMRDVGGG
jgi:ubiquinol-cytochrome c reductase cytochrome b subunit